MIVDVLFHQGFHRYSTDKFWHVPHFEKMLYDQGQLATIYATAYQVPDEASCIIVTSGSISESKIHLYMFECIVQITKDEFFSEVVRDILLYVSRDLSDKVHVHV